MVLDSCKKLPTLALRLLLLPSTSRLDTISRKGEEAEQTVECMDRDVHHGVHQRTSGYVHAYLLIHVCLLTDDISCSSFFYLAKDILDACSQVARFLNQTSFHLRLGWAPQYTWGRVHPCSPGWKLKVHESAGTGIE